MNEFIINLQKENSDTTAEFFEQSLSSSPHHKTSIDSDDSVGKVGSDYDREKKSTTASWSADRMSTKAPTDRYTRTVSVLKQFLCF